MTIIMFATGLMAGAGVGAFVRILDKVKVPAFSFQKSHRLALKAV